MTEPVIRLGGPEGAICPVLFRREDGAYAIGWPGQTSGVPMFYVQLDAEPDARRYSWQECPECGGVFVLWAEADAPPIHERVGVSTVDASWFRYRDGSTPSTFEIIHCNDCGTTEYTALAPKYRRWGREVPSRRPPPEPR